MTVEEITEMMHHKPRWSYFFKWMNVVKIVMLTLFLVGAVLWIIGYSITGGWSIMIQDTSLTGFAEHKDGYQLLLVGNSIFSLAIVVSVFHLVDLCQVRSYALFNFLRTMHVSRWFSLTTLGRMAENIVF